MSDCCPEEKLSKRRRLTKKLIEGKEWAIQLKNIVLQKPHLLLREDQVDESVSTHVRQLVVNIYTSFTESLMVLNSINTAHAQSGGDEVCQIKPEPSHLDHSQCDERSNEDSGEIQKQDRRGCYKRRKASNSWKVVASTIDDGQAWRKYGQKSILNAPYPRAYYRCSHKFDKGCKATKQVQQIQGHPRRYETTYIGQHICGNMLIKTVIPQLSKLGVSNDWKPNNNYIFGKNSTTSSQTRIGNYKPEEISSLTYKDHIIKEDMSISTKEERAPSTDLSDNLSSLDNNNNYISCSDLEVAFELSEPTIFSSFPKTMMSDQSLGNMDFIAKSTNIDGDFRFDDPEFI